jgi:hypothetical protein
MPETKKTDETAKAVTDRELLAICNLSNLKLEFADLAKTRNEQTKEILSNHTIASLLEKERGAIINGLSGKNDRVFYGIVGSEEKKEDESAKTGETDSNKAGGDTDTSSETKKEEATTTETTTEIKSKKTYKWGPIYNTLMDLKSSAGIVYEYFEKFKDHKNNEGAFTDQWEILFAGDSYQLIKQFVEYATKSTGKPGIILRYEDEEGIEYYILKNKSGKYMKYINGKSNETKDTDEHSQYDKDVKIIENSKFYDGYSLNFPTRDEIQDFSFIVSSFVNTKSA